MFSHYTFENFKIKTPFLKGYRGATYGLLSKSRDEKVKALEVGGTASAFLNKVEIMASQNSRFLFNIFLSYRFGRIIQGGHLENVEMTE